MKNVPVITIDGPSGSGKGTIAASVAQRLGWRALDSGALYRALAWAVLHCQISPDDPAALLQAVEQIKINLTRMGQEIRWQGHDISKDSRGEACAAMASCLGANREVRRLLLPLQRQCQQHPGLIADGRDMGTIVFPEAPFKIFLDADPAERAMRRYKQLKQNAISVTLKQVAEDLRIRDERDRTRDIAQLTPAADALCIDTTNLTIEQVVTLILTYVKEKQKDLDSLSKNY